MKAKAKTVITLLQGLHVLHGKKQYFLRRFKSHPLELIL